MIHERDITRQVFAALIMMSDERRKWVEASFPRPVAALFVSFAGVKGYGTYEALQNGSRRYLSFVLQKPI